MANKTTTLQVTQATHDLIMQIKIARHLDSADEVIRALLPTVKRKGAGENLQPSKTFSGRLDLPSGLGRVAGSLEASLKKEENKK